MPEKETLTTRVTRLEQLHADLAEKLGVLVDSQIRYETEGRERERRLDERIDKLVSAIGELIRRNGKDT